MNEKVQEGFGYRVKNTDGDTGILLKILYVEGTYAAVVYLGTCPLFFIPSPARRFRIFSKICI